MKSDDVETLVVGGRMVDQVVYVKQGDLHASSDATLFRRAVSNAAGGSRSQCGPTAVGVASYWVTTMLPFSPCIRQWNANVPVAVIATGLS